MRASCDNNIANRSQDVKHMAIIKLFLSYSQLLPGLPDDSGYSYRDHYYREEQNDKKLREA